MKVRSDRAGMIVLASVLLVSLLSWILLTGLVSLASGGQWRHHLFRARTVMRLREHRPENGAATRRRRAATFKGKRLLFRSVLRDGRFDAVVGPEDGVSGGWAPVWGAASQSDLRARAIECWEKREREALRTLESEHRAFRRDESRLSGRIREALERAGLSPRQAMSALDRAREDCARQLEKL